MSNNEMTDHNAGGKKAFDLLYDSQLHFNRPFNSFSILWIEMRNVSKKLLEISYYQ
jgi:hypothetical protein